MSSATFFEAINGAHRGSAGKGGLMEWARIPVSLPKTRFVRTGDAIRPRLHVRRCPRSGRSGARPAHPFRAKHEDATHYNRRRISQGSAVEHYLANPEIAFINPNL